MNKLEVEGTLDKATGKLKEVAGKVTNSPSTVAAGKKLYTEKQAGFIAGKGSF